MSNIVAIVGRPNVGKSTLFNRFVGGKKAIVDDLPGVTRDRYYDVAHWNGHYFTVIDTGGYLETTENALQRAVTEQVKFALQEADVILFVVDCRTGIQPQDEDLAALLRKYQKPVLVVANKADSRDLVLAASTFYQFGLGKVYEIAAASGSGTGELLDALVTHLAPGEPEQEEDLAKLAIIGRPNVGKSTFVNALLGAERSIVSAEPNTTRAPVHSYYQAYNKRLILVDTAGIRKKKQVAADTIEFYSLIRSIKAVEQSDVCIILINAAEGLTSQDKNIMNLAHRRKKGMVLLVNKWDTITKEAQTADHYQQALAKQLGYMDYVPILFTSGLHKKGIYQTIEKALAVNENRKRRLTTSTVNKIVLKAVEQNPPPIAKGKQVTMKYATQLPVNTPSFAIFCNAPENVSPTYKRYLEKQFRAYFNFEGVPITLYFREK